MIIEHPLTFFSSLATVYSKDSLMLVIVSSAIE